MEDDHETPEFRRAAYERRLERFCRWNGDGPAPQFSHWTSRGTVVIRSKNPTVPLTELFFNGRSIGFGGVPELDAKNFATKRSYDDMLGFPAEELGVPADLFEWNNLG